ncbi:MULTISPECIES: hypothetical protein [Cyanophyceae]|uniref:hypothetical protein n=1 Tax=Cyanophyceae TaxID=3028117 RepID=UPI0011149519|nr:MULTISPECIES: hypothetical protein [Cyanophyceae]
MFVSCGWCCGASPVGCSAPFVSSVVPLARASGASFLCCRPSSRSFSRWVVVGFFSSRAAAGAFAASAARLLSAAEFSAGASFCVVRRSGSWWCVSVPVFVVLFASGSCPSFWARLS